MEGIHIIIARLVGFGRNTRGDIVPVFEVIILVETVVVEDIDDGDVIDMVEDGLGGFAATGSFGRGAADVVHVDHSGDEPQVFTRPRRRGAHPGTVVEFEIPRA